MHRSAQRDGIAEDGVGEGKWEEEGFQLERRHSCRFTDLARLGHICYANERADA